MKQLFTRNQKILDAFSLLAFSAFIIYVLFTYRSAAQIDPVPMRSVPVKAILIAAPLIAVIGYLLISIIAYFPGIWTMKHPLEDDKHAIFRTLQTFLILLKIELVVFFFYIYYISANNDRFSAFLLGLLIVLILTTLLISIKDIHRIAR